MTTTRSRLAATLVALLGLASAVLAQPGGAGNNTGNPLDPQPNGPRKAEPAWHFLVGPTVHVSPGVVIESAIVEIEGDRIVSVTDMTTVRFAPPPGAQVHDLAGMHIYAGFIDAHLAIDAPRPDMNAPGAHWNAGVTPQRSALDAGGVPAGDAERLRGLGFTAAAIAPDGGIFAGRAALVSLAQAPADAADARAPVYGEDVYQTLAFTNRGTPSNRGEFTGYPGSQMGVIALMRQTLSDADWLAAVSSAPSSSTSSGGGAHWAPSTPPCLTSLTTNLPLLFRTADELEGLRAFKIAREFDRIPIILGSGTEFRRLDAIPIGPETNTGYQPHYILPLTFPETPEIDTIGKADSTDLRDLMTWEQAPTNARRLDEAGAVVALTAGGLRKGEKFDKNLREAMKVGGLTGERALAMLTTNPAAMLGASDNMGTVEPNKLANLIVATGDLFAEPEAQAKSQTTEPEAQARSRSKDAAEILDVWIDGQRHAINAPPPPFDGEWTLRVGDFFSMKLVIEGDKVTGIEGEGDDANEGEARKVTIDANTRTISFLLDDTDDGTGTYVQTGILGPDGVIRGTGIGADNNPFEWTATRTEPEAPARDQPEDDEADEADEADEVDEDDEADEADKSDDDQPDDLPPADLPGYPFGPYAAKELPAQQTVIFHNATIWTSGPDGLIDNGWMAIEEGKIIAVQPGGVIDILTRHDPVMIDLEGRHITPGLLDAHSHTGISRGVNEGGQAVTAEVRIGDVTDPDSINWYRQLAGGVTTVNSMHGSANPIGGQTQTNKVRWGAVHPDDMHMEGAKPGIKFALGENVKQSNWGDGNTTRYPQTRMGVETLIRDRFAAAREYAAAQATERRSDGATKGDIEYAAEQNRGLPGGMEHADKDLPRSDRVAESDGHGQSGLSRLGEDAAGRAVRADPADEGFGGIGGRQHRGGPRASEPTGLHPLSSDRERFPPRDDDTLRAGDFDDDDAGSPADDRPDAGDRPGAAGAHPEPGSQERSELTEATPSSLRRSVAPSLLPPRRDLELEALAEILAGERLVHCHSYRQDEILMLCRVAEDFGFRIGTFQHGLEVYKVAEAVKEHAVGASLFADWWAYKVEVQDAIAQAGPLQSEVGVLTSYNSDSDELSRRMHVEAAKAYKYSGGRLSKEDALKFVTINPAIQLGIGDRVGSIEVGKDADLAIWSGEPLSSFSMCEATWIDGREYFSLERDAVLREQNAAHRTRITQKILTEGAPKPKKEGDEPDGEDDADDGPDSTTDEDPPPNRSMRERMAVAARQLHYFDLYLKGINPADHRCGDCGASDLQLGGHR